MPERRTNDRLDAPDRRSFPRPPLWLNLLLLLLGLGVVLYARHHREQVAKQFAHVIQQEQRTPEDVRKLKSELADLDISHEALQKELEGRMKLVGSLKSENFHLSIDTKARKLRFYYGDTVLREADVLPGDHKTLSAAGKSWTFVPLKGAFPIEAKVVGYDWRVPEWMYALNGQPVPAERPVIDDGLGKYVLFLPNGYVIHTTPPPGSPLQGPKPGSFLVAEEEAIRAIWPRIAAGKTQVYIY